MDAIKYQFSSKKFLIIIILISLFLGAAFYVYNNYIAPRLNPKFVSNREFTKEEAVNNTELYFIFADWCPYSKKVMPIWDNLKEKYDRKKVNNYAVIFKELDGDKNESEIDDFSKRFNKKIEGYPTIILIKQNEVIEFDADPTKENLTAFIEKTL
jgi:thiol-disulfide isomerase/thioredoxin|tara:strand:+ start:289 stop:753 length:465 start_codon:yes stop_codon:yes gene_type:complete